LRQSSNEKLVGTRNRPFHVNLPAPNGVLPPKGLRGGVDVAEGDIAETTRPPIRPAEHHRVNDGAKASEVVAEVLRCRFVREAADEDLPRVALLLRGGAIGNGTARTLLLLMLLLLLLLLKVAADEAGWAALLGHRF
jgi:hypothetical protein